MKVYLLAHNNWSAISFQQLKVPAPKNETLQNLIQIEIYFIYFVSNTKKLRHELEEHVFQCKSLTPYYNYAMSLGQKRV